MTSEALRASEEVKSAKRAAAERATASQDYKKAFFLPKAVYLIGAKFSIENHFSLC